MIVVLMGVCGCGKTAVGRALAQALDWSFLDADDFHPLGNVAKMAAGTPLTDDDRWPWLHAIAAAIDAARAGGQSAVVACSALKRAYRDILVGSRPDVVLVYLQGSHDLLARRAAARTGHFMPPALLDSQFATLEEPAPEERAIVVSVDAAPEAIVDAVITQLRERTA